MKTYIFFTAIISFILIGCSSKEKTAKSLIKEDLKENMNDFDSYEPIHFSKLYASGLDSLEYRKLELGDGLTVSLNSYLFCCIPENGIKKHI